MTHCVLHHPEDSTIQISCVANINWHFDAAEALGHREFMMTRLFESA